MSRVTHNDAPLRQVSGGSMETWGPLPTPNAPRALDGQPHSESRALSLFRALFRLRPEEVIALAFLLPTTYLTVVANVYARRTGVLGDRHPGGIARLGLVVLLLGVMAWLWKRWPRAFAVKTLREVLPFAACILIYTNLHDTIGFVNRHDVHHYLDALDRELFGVQPTVWAEQFITPTRTEVMQFFYMNFFWLAPSTGLILLMRRRWPEFRTTTFGVLLCFYLGYLLYVLFPAAPPRLVLVYDFTRNLAGNTRLFSTLSARAFELLPVDSRAAFPSLHAAASLVALLYAWRYVRAWFYVLLPFVLGLWVATIYLRHHYAVDLLAGWALAPVAMLLAPRIDGWWARQQVALGITPARGASASSVVRER